MRCWARLTTQERATPAVSWTTRRRCASCWSAPTVLPRPRYRRGTLHNRNSALHVDHGAAAHLAFEQARRVIDRLRQTDLDRHRIQRLGVRSEEHTSELQ